MALAAATVWEVRPTTGNDTNGGGFVAGQSGTDWTQQASPQYAVVDGVTAGTTTITSATANFGTDVVGNLVYVAGGTGSITAGWYQIVSRTNSTTIVVDRSTGLTTGTGVTLNIGGALATLATLAAQMVSSNKAFLKAESGYSSTATNTFAAAGVTPTATAMPTRLIGYTTTRGDGGKATLTLSTNTGITGILLSNRGWFIENIIVDCASLGTSTGFQLSQYTNIKNCTAKNFTTAGIYTAGNGLLSIINCVATGGTSAATAGMYISSSDAEVIFCNIHDNACPGILGNPGSGTKILFNLIVNNTGASSDGIQYASGAVSNVIMNNTISGSGRSGLRLFSGSFLNPCIIKNNIFANNGAWGIDAFTQGWFADSGWDGNAYYNNTSGNRHDMDDITTNPQNGVAPYTNVLDVILTANPFTNSVGGDYTLNNTAGGGAACRGSGTPGTFPT